MAQRNLFPTSQMPTMDQNQIWNHPSHPDPHLHLGATNGSYMLPMDGSRPNDYRSPFMNNMVPNSGHPYLHLSSTASSSRFPPSLVHHNQTEIGRSAYKRKSPVIPLAYGEGNTSGCYNAGSSSSYPKPMVMPQYRPLDDPCRNVRSRHVQTNPAVAYSSANPALHFHQGQLNHLPILPMPPQGDPRINFEANQFVGGPTIINGFHPSLTQSRNSIPSTRGVGYASNGHYQRSNPYRYFRPLSITGHSGHRNVRTRGSNSRFAEDAVLMDRSGYYESRTWFDQHGDMRLDIDNMSYEELLALGERIGKVSTGLSEEAMYGCLKEATHCSSEEDDEVKCVICLEGYKDEDKLGRLNCGHEFHASCIKNWLRIKNACPVCKAAASNYAKEEEQSIVSASG